MANASSYLNNQGGTAFPLRYWELIWYCVILVTGALGNVLVCLVICKSSKLFRSVPFNMYLCSLAVADILLALVVLPNYLFSTPIFNHPCGVWGDVMCKTISADFITFYFSTVSEYSLVLISLERLHAVHKFPVAGMKSPSRKKKAWLSIVITWFIPLAFHSPKFIYLLEYKRRQRPVIGNYCRYVWGRDPTPSSKIYGGVILMVEGILPLVILIYSFCSIRRCLLNQEKKLFGGIRGKPSNYGSTTFSSWQTVERRQRTVKILVMVTIVFVVCWMPNGVMFFIIDFMGEKHSNFTWNSPLYQVGILMRFTGSCINPYLYAWQSTEFRKHSKKALKSLLPRCLDDNFKYTQLENEGEQDRNRHILGATEVTRPEQTERDSQAGPIAPAFLSKAGSSRANTRTRTPSINVAI